MSDLNPIKSAKTRALYQFEQEICVGGRDSCFRLLFSDYAVTSYQREAYARAALKVINCPTFDEKG